MFFSSARFPESSIARRIRGNVPQGSISAGLGFRRVWAGNARVKPTAKIPAGENALKPIGFLRAFRSVITIVVQTPVLLPNDPIFTREKRPPTDALNLVRSLRFDTAEGNKKQKVYVSNICVGRLRWQNTGAAGV